MQLFYDTSEYEVYEIYRREIDRARAQNGNKPIVYDAFTYSEEELLSLLERIKKTDDDFPRNSRCFREDSYDGRANMCYRFLRGEMNKYAYRMRHLYRDYTSIDVPQWKPSFKTQSDLDAYRTHVEKEYARLKEEFPWAYDAVVYKPFTNSIPIDFEHLMHSVGAHLITFVLFGLLLILLAFLVHTTYRLVYPKPFIIELPQTIPGVTTAANIECGANDTVLDICAKLPQYRLVFTGYKNTEQILHKHAANYFRDAFRAVAWTPEYETFRLTVEKHAEERGQPIAVNNSTSSFA